MILKKDFAQKHFIGEMQRLVQHFISLSHEIVRIRQHSFFDYIALPHDEGISNSDVIMSHYQQQLVHASFTQYLETQLMSQGDKFLQTEFFNKIFPTLATKIQELWKDEVKKYMSIVSKGSAHEKEILHKLNQAQKNFEDNNKFIIESDNLIEKKIKQYSYQKKVLADLNIEQQSIQDMQDYYKHQFGDIIRLLAQYYPNLSAHDALAQHQPRTKLPWYQKLLKSKEEILLDNIVKDIDIKNDLQKKFKHYDELKHNLHDIKNNQQVIILGMQTTDMFLERYHTSQNKHTQLTHEINDLQQEVNVLSLGKNTLMPSYTNFIKEHIFVYFYSMVKSKDAAIAFYNIVQHANYDLYESLQLESIVGQIHANSLHINADNASILADFYQAKEDLLKIFKDFSLLFKQVDQFLGNPVAIVWLEGSNSEQLKIIVEEQLNQFSITTKKMLDTKAHIEQQMQLAVNNKEHNLSTIKDEVKDLLQQVAQMHVPNFIEYIYIPSATLGGTSISEKALKNNMFRMITKS